MKQQRIFRSIAATLGLGVVFALAMVMALVLHLDLPRGRRLLSHAIANALDNTLQGHFVIGGIERVGPTGLVLLDVKVRDPEQRLVLTASRIRVQSPLLFAVWRLLSEAEKVTLEIEQVDIEHAEAAWYGDANGVPSIARAFTPRPAPGPARPPGEKSREIRVAVRSIHLERGFARGAPFGLPTLEAEVSQVRGFVLATPLGAEIGLGRFGLVARGLGGADLRGVSSLRLRSPGYVFTSFDGHFGEVQVGCIVRADGDHLTITLDLPGVQGEQLRAVAPGIPLVSPLEAHIEAEGVLPMLRTSAELRIGQTTRAVVAGMLDFTREPRAHLEVDAKALDLRSFSTTLPPSGLDARAVVELSTGSELALQADIFTEAGVVAGASVPPAELSATLRGGLLTGRAHLAEPLLPLNATFALRPDGSADFSAETPALELQSPRLRTLGARGTGSARLVAHVDHGLVRVDANANLAHVARGNLRAERLKLALRARGRLDDLAGLNVDGTFEAAQAQGPDVAFDQMRGTVKGPLSAPLVTASALDARGGTIEAKARVSQRGDGARVAGLSFAFKREQTTLEGSAEELDFSGGRVKLSGVDLRGGGGTLRGSFELSDTLFSVEAKGEKLNFGKLARVLGLPSHWVAGELDFDADVLVARDIERGVVNLTLREGALGPLSEVTSSLHARLENRRLEGDLSADVRGILRAAGRFGLDIPGSIRDPKAMRDSVGEVELDVQDVDLTLLGHALAPGREPLVSGKLAFLLKATRRSPYTLPNLALSGYTDGLEVDTKTLLASNERLTGVDARFGLDVSGESGTSDVSFKLVDTRGSLASASASTTIDLVEFLAHPTRIVTQLLSTELGGKVLLEERAFDELPAALRPEGVTGRVRAELAINGTLAKPSLAGRARFSRLEWVENGAVPLDLCATFGFEPDSRKVGSRGELFASRPGSNACEGRRIGQYSLTATLGPAERRFFPTDGSVVASLERTPLGALPALAELGFGGEATGTLSLSMNGNIPALVANLALANASIHEVPIGDGRLELRSNEKALGLSLEVARGNGRIQATAFAALDYSEPMPRLVPDEPIGVRVTAEHADAVVLSPFTRDLFSEVGGQVDADLTLSLRRQPNPKGVVTTTGNVSGSFALHQGTLELARLGLRLFDTELSAKASSADGMTLIDFGEIRAKAGREKQSLRLRNGKLWLSKLEIERAQGAIDASELPLGIEGVPLATATTRQSIGFEIQRGEKAMRARIDVPYLVVALPQASARALISLDENRSIEIVQALGAPRKTDDESLPWQLEFALGENVKLTRSDLDLPLSGEAVLTLGHELSVTGDVKLTPGGRVDVSGKTFVIESGEVHFDNGEPENPRLRVTASWRAPDGSTVTADVSGTLKEPILALSSPGKTAQEVYALLLGGSGETGDARAASAGVGADRLLGPLLENTPLRHVELRTGSERTADQRTYSTYSAAMPVGENLWFEGSYKSLTGADASDVANSSAANAWSGTVDWRFRKNWSLRTEIGTIGAGLDLVWNHRY